MAKIKFEDGTVVNFDGDPTPQDVEEVARSLFGEGNPRQQEPEGKTGIKGFGLGILKGAGSTLRGGLNLVGSGLDKIGGVVDKTMGVKPQAKVPTVTESVDWALPKARVTPHGGTEKAGFVTEQIGEFLIPGGAPAKVGKAVEGVELLAKAPTAVKALARIGTTAAAEGLLGAGQAKLQGGDAKTTGLVSAAIPVLGGTWRGLRSLIPAAEVAPKVQAAIGKVAQGTTEDIPVFKRALELVNTKGVKTFQDLQKKFDDLVPDLAQKVDLELIQDPKLYKAKDLVFETTSNMGKKIKTDYVGQALKDLSEMYGKIGDRTMKTNMDEVISQFKNQGLTRLDVNDLSRLYNKEFGDKAFSKLGDPLTSVNAQAFEMTRKGLKKIARLGIGGEEAKALDAKLSDIFDAQRLVQKNVEAVNKLQQKIQQRGLLGKVGYGLSKGLDLATGGTIRGIVEGLLPRGVGYKVMNAVDIEKALQSNLKLVRKALQENDDAALVRILKSAVPPAVKATIKAGTSQGTRSD